MNRKLALCVIQIIIVLFYGVALLLPARDITLGKDELTCYREDLVSWSPDGAIAITYDPERDTLSDAVLFRSKMFNCPKGVYTISVAYDMNNWKGELGQSNGYIELLPGRTETTYVTNCHFLTEKNYNSERFYVTSNEGTDLSIVINYFGFWNLSINEIKIEELVIYRWFRFGCVLGIFLIMDYVLFLANRNRKRVAVSVLGISLLASLPVFYNKLYYGHDLHFHLCRIAEIAQGMLEGNWNVRIQPNMLNGYGYATPLFYPQLFLYIPAALYCVGLRLQTAYQVFVFCCNLFTASICYYCFRKLVDNNYRIAMLGTCLYVLCPYRFSNLYIRASVGECLAMCFWPLVVYGLYSLYRKEKEETYTLFDILPLALGLCGMIQSHILSCYMVALVVITWMVVFLKKTLEWRRLLALISTAVMALMLNAGFLITLLSSLKMDIKVNGESNKLSGQGAFPIQFFSVFGTANGHGSFYSAKDDFPLAIGIGMIVGVFIAIYLLMHTKILSNHEKKMYCFWACMSILFAAMSLYNFPWDIIQGTSNIIANFFGVVQFPWRYLALSATFGSFATVVGLKLFSDLRKDKLSELCVLLLTVSILSTSYFFTDLVNNIDEVTISNISAMDDRAIGNGEYIPEYVNRSMYDVREVVAGGSDIEVSGYGYCDGVTSFYCSNGGMDGCVIVPLNGYDGYRAYREETSEQLCTSVNDDFRLAIFIPAGFDGKVRIEYDVPYKWRVGEFVSALSFIGLLFVVIYVKMRNLRKENRLLDRMEKSV